MSPDRRSARGQAATEYAALLTLVALVVLAGVALTSGGLGDRIVYAMQRGLCAVTGGSCPASHPVDRPDLAACPLQRSANTQSASGSAGFGTANVGLGLQLERRSDGTASVSFSDSAQAGLTAGVGAHYSVGRIGGSARADVSVTMGFTRGRTWNFPSVAAAQRFVGRFGGHQDLLGRAGDDLLDVCFLCHWAGWRRDRPPAPDVELSEGGGRLSASAQAGLGRASVEARAALEGALGRRTTRDGEVTYYVRLGASAAASLEAIVGLHGSAGATGIGAYTVGPDGRPRRLVLSSVRTWEGAGFGHVAGPPARLPRGLDALGATARGSSGTVLESEATLDLENPANADAARALVAALGRGGGPSLDAATRTLGQRFARDGVTTLRRFALTGSHGGISAGVALGAKVDGGIEHVSQGLDLVAVLTRLPGLPFRSRADCLVV